MSGSYYDVVIVGGGPAGMAAALGARGAGAERVLIIERERELGGVLRQCVHTGFGLLRFGEELTGPTYAHRYMRMVQDAGIDVSLDTAVLSTTPDLRVECVGPIGGVRTPRAGAIVHAMGCRERGRGAIRIPGSRPAGVFTAGSAQSMVNLEGYLPGREVVILGSGDIGLIMARRMTLEGAKVRAVFEIMPYSNGLTRNIAQCLIDFDIPLHLGRTVTAIRGEGRVTGVTVAAVDSDLRPISGTEFDVPCDCVLLSVGLIPENELAREIGIQMDPATGGAMIDQFRRASVPGYFAAGNVLHVHDLVDLVSEEAETAGRSAALFARGALASPTSVRRITAGAGLRSVVPQRVALPAEGETVRFHFRAAKPTGAARLHLRLGRDVVWSRRLRIVKPSEMIVADIPIAALTATAETPEFFISSGEERAS